MLLLSDVRYCCRGAFALFSADVVIAVCVSAVVTSPVMVLAVVEMCVVVVMPNVEVLELLKEEDVDVLVDACLELLC